MELSLNGENVLELKSEKANGTTSFDSTKPLGSFSKTLSTEIDGEFFEKYIQPMSTEHMQDMMIPNIVIAAPADVLKDDCLSYKIFGLTPYKSHALKTDPILFILNDMFILYLQAGPADS